MRKRKTYLMPFFVVLAFSGTLLFPLCTSEKETTKIRLRWVKAYPAETWANVTTGIYWSLSYLGAALDTAHANEIIVREDSMHFTLDLEKAGFDQQALRAFGVIIDSLEQTGEYEKYGAIDLARFLVLTEHSSRHYYEITGVAKTMNEFYKRHHAMSDKEFHVYNSGVAKHQRNIRFTLGASALDMAWVAEEGLGSLDSGTFVRSAFEVFDVMKNGQLRFAVYDKASGELMEGSPAGMSAAGKPSKCIWCHELSVQTLFVPNPEPAKGMSIRAFTSLVDSAQKQLEHYRAGLHGLIDYTQKQAHTQGELIYISFMEPSAFRLANEWGSDTVSVKKRMEKISTHVYEEFPFLGNSYYRSYADSVSGYRPARVPLSVRELYADEPDYLRKR